MLKNKENKTKYKNDNEPAHRNMLPTDRTPRQKGILPAKGAFFHINHVYITARSTSTKDNPFP